MVVTSVILVHILLASLVKTVKLSASELVQNVQKARLLLPHSGSDT